MEYLLDGFLKAIQLLIYGDEETFSAVIATLELSAYAMAASLSIGIPLGFLLGYFDFRGKKQVRLVVDTLLAIPTVFIGLVVYSFLSYRGPLGHWGLLFTIPGVAIGQTLLALPIVIALTAMAVETMDSQLRVTLMSLGADRRQLFISTLREVRYGILTAAMTAFGRVLTEVGISMMVGGNIKWYTRTITSAIALETNKGMFAMGMALGFVLITIAFLVNISVSFLKKR